MPIRDNRQPRQLRRKHILHKRLIQSPNHVNQPRLLEPRPQLPPHKPPPDNLVLPLPRLTPRLGPRPLHLEQRIRRKGVLLRLPYKLPPREVEPAVPPVPFHAVLPLENGSRRGAEQRLRAPLENSNGRVPLRLDGIDLHLYAGRGKVGGAVQRRQPDLVAPALGGLEDPERLAAFLVGGGLDFEVEYVAGGEDSFARGVDVVGYGGERGIEGGGVSRHGVLKEVLEARLDGEVGVIGLVGGVSREPNLFLRLVSNVHFV